MSNMTPEEMNKMFMVSEEKVAKAIKILIDTYHPLYIYSFGSYARDMIHEDSDFDVLVVIDEFDDKPWKVMARGYEALSGIKMPIDLLVYDRAIFETKKNIVSTFCYSIVKKGKLMYERA